MKLDSLIADKKYHFWIFFSVLLFLSVFCSFAYGTQFLGGDDYYFHNARFEALMQGLKDGTFPSYIDYQGLYGYGYLVKTFYSDFILIPYALLANLTSKDFAYWFLYFSMTMMCGTFMYIFVHRVYKSVYVASVSSILYTFCLYRLLDLYYRGAWGEAFSFTFLPIVFLGLFYIIKGDYRKWYVIAIGFSLMIFTHVLSTLLLFITVSIMLVVYYRDMIKEPKRIYYLILAGVVTIVLTSYYLFPFFEQLLSDTFYFQKFKYSPYTTAQSRLDWLTILRGSVEGFTLGQKSTGIGLLLLAPLCLRFFVRGNKKQKKYIRSIDIGVLIGLFYIVLTSTLTPWTRFPLSYLSLIQFPWRLYEFVVFFFSVAGAYYIYLLCKKKNIQLVAFLLLVVLTSVVIVIDASTYKEIKVEARLSDKDYLNETTHYTMAGMEYYPSRMPYPDPFILQRGDSVTSQLKETEVYNFERFDYITRFDIKTNVKDSIELPLIYYKGYAASLDGVSIPVTESSQGLVQIPIDRSGRVEAYYKGTLVQKLSFYITILSIFVLCSYIFLQRRKDKHLK